MKDEKRTAIEREYIMKKLTAPSVKHPIDDNEFINESEGFLVDRANSSVICKCGNEMIELLKDYDVCGDGETCFLCKKCASIAFTTEGFLIGVMVRGDGEYKEAFTKVSGCATIN